jgi:hypothetical protein
LVFRIAAASVTVGCLPGLPFLSSLVMVQVTGSVIALPLAPLVALMVTSASAAACATLPATRKAAAETPMASRKVATRVKVRTGHPSKIK